MERVVQKLSFQFGMRLVLQRSCSLSWLRVRTSSHASVGWPNGLRCRRARGGEDRVPLKLAGVPHESFRVDAFASVHPRRAGQLAIAVFWQFAIIFI